VSLERQARDWNFFPHPVTPEVRQPKRMRTGNRVVTTEGGLLQPAVVPQALERAFESVDDIGHVRRTAAHALTIRRRF